MKKIGKLKNKLVILTILVVLSCISSVNVHALTCNDSYGTTIIGENGVKYCASKKGYKNHYAAEAWCQSIGGHLIDLKADCDGAVYDEYCNNLKGKGNSNWYRTNSYYGGVYNLIIRLSDGYVHYDFLNGGRNYAVSYNFALCR